MSVRRHIGNPEVRARSGPESRRGRAHRKRRHVGRDKQPATSAVRKAGSGRREEGSERRAGGGAGRGSVPQPASCPQDRLATSLVVGRNEVHKDTVLRLTV
jgi:hypothetical protein